MPQGKTVKDWRKLARVQFQEGLEDDSSNSFSHPSAAEDISSWNGFFVKKSAQHRAATRKGFSTESTSSKRESTRSAGDENTSSLCWKPGRLYGREKEEKLLKQQLSAAERSVILVSGEPGVGKSALVGKLASPVQQGGGIYVRGKYDSLYPPAPYSGITAACRGICEYLSEHKPTNEQLEQLRTELGSSVHILSELMPDLLGWVKVVALKEDPTFATREARVSESQNRFVFAVKTFLRVVAGWGRVVMVLDDLQWADKESFGLLECIMNDSDLKQFILVGCYRNGEVDDKHSLTIWRNVMNAKHNCLRFVSVELSNLEVETVNEMVADVLQMDSETTREVAELVQQKTLGNAFFTVEILKMLNEENVVGFHTNSGKRILDVGEIEIRTQATDDVVDLIREKMLDLDDEVSEVFPLAACLGSSFTARTLSVVVEVFQQEKHFLRPDVSEEKSGAKQWLKTCIGKGFIDKVQKGRYAWAHVKFQEAALALLMPRKLEEVQFRVGEVLLRHLSQREISENIFVVTNLLNKGTDTKFEINIDRQRIARLNLDAAKAAMASASFAQAVVHLRAALKCLPRNHWVTDSALSLDLYSSVAEAEYCIGDVASAERRCHVILDQNRPVGDKIRAYNVLVSLVGNHNVHAACEIIVEVLKDLGCTFPRFGQRLTVLRGVYKLQSDTKKYSPEDFATHRTMIDPAQIHAMGMLDKLATFASFTNTHYLPMSILKSCEWTTVRGTSEYSSVAFALGGLTLCAQVKVSLHTEAAAIWKGRGALPQTRHHNHAGLRGRKKTGRVRVGDTGSKPRLRNNRSTNNIPCPRVLYSSHGTASVFTATISTRIQHGNGSRGRRVCFLERLPAPGLLLLPR